MEDLGVFSNHGSLKYKSFQHISSIPSSHLSFDKPMDGVFGESLKEETGIVTITASS